MEFKVEFDGVRNSLEIIRECQTYGAEVTQIENSDAYDVSGLSFETLRNIPGITNILLYDN